ncbi:MAG: hypothetical protein AB1Z29_20915 [Desulfobacterales bacterium]
MGGRRLIFISMLAIFVVIEISLGSASALDFADYNGTWYKIKAKLNGVCQDDELEMSKESAKEIAWIYIESLEIDPGIASLVTQNEDDTWQATDITLSILLGTADDAVLESNEDITIVDSDGDQFVLFFIVRLKGKENRNGELKKTTKVRNVVGIAEVLTVDDDECVTSLSVNGGLKKEKNVPDEVFDAVFSP